MKKVAFKSLMGASSLPAQTERNFPGHEEVLKDLFFHMALEKDPEYPLWDDTEMNEDLPLAVNS